MLSVPRMNIDVAWPGPPLRPMSIPASSRNSSARSFANDSSISSRVITVTGTIASSNGISVRVAVTMIVSPGARSAAFALAGIDRQASMTAGGSRQVFIQCSSAYRPHASSYRLLRCCGESGRTAWLARPNRRPPRHSRIHRAGLRADERTQILAVTPSRDPLRTDLVRG